MYYGNNSGNDSNSNLILYSNNSNRTLASGGALATAGAGGVALLPGILYHICVLLWLTESSIPGCPVFALMGGPNPQQSLWIGLTPNPFSHDARTRTRDLSLGRRGPDDSTIAADSEVYCIIMWYNMICDILYYNVLYYAMLCYALRYSTILYYSYYNILYYTHYKICTINMIFTIWYIR